MVHALVPNSPLFRPVYFILGKLSNVLVSAGQRCGVCESSKPWGKLDALDENDDIFEMEVIKEEFAYRTHVAIALANYALENKKGQNPSVQHGVAKMS